MVLSLFGGRFYYSLEITLILRKVIEYISISSLQGSCRMHEKGAEGQAGIASHLTTYRPRSSSKGGRAHRSSHDDSLDFKSTVNKMVRFKDDYEICLAKAGLQ